MKRIIAITGGIGAGKSVVCRMLRSMGYPVYDCDIEARILMDRSVEIKRSIAEKISPDAITKDGKICRPTLSTCVFSNSEKLKTLNDIVHGAVREHFSRWVDKQTASMLFVETAILYESGMDKMVNEVWEVTAPREVRIQRVMERNAMTREQVEQRISNQSVQSNPSHRILLNDGHHTIISQIIKLLKTNQK